MKAYEATSIGENRGRPRLWLQGMKAAIAGFLPRMRFTIRKDPERHMLILELDQAGTRVVSRKVINDREIPIIDINSSEHLSMFEGFKAVRVIVQTNRIIILPLASELAKKERLERLRKKLDSGEPLSIGSLAHGGGILSHALHTGLKEAGIPTRLAFANEIRPELLEHCREHNDIWDQDTLPVSAPMQEFAFDSWASNRLPRCDVIEAGLACSGASVAGRARRGAGHAEAHPEVGHLVVAFLAIIAKANPSVVILENVPQYQTSASMCIIRNQLRDMGYKVHETTLDAGDWNALEHRSRLCVVAVTEGIDFDFQQLLRPEKRVRHMAEILEDIPDDHPSWSQMDGLKAKEKRDLAEGKHFKMQILNPFSTSCPTIGKGYAKNRSTEPKVASSTRPGVMRLMTVMEHLRAKAIPPHLVSSLGFTIGHQVAGQSVCYEPFQAVGYLIGNFLNQCRADRLMVSAPDLFSLFG